MVVLKGRDGSSGQNGTQVCHLLLLFKYNQQVLHSIKTFSFPEAALLLGNIKNRDLWEGNLVPRVFFKTLGTRLLGGSNFLSMCRVRHLTLTVSLFMARCTVQMGTSKVNPGGSPVMEGGVEILLVTLCN